MNLPKIGDTVRTLRQYNTDGSRMYDREGLEGTVCSVESDAFSIAREGWGIVPLKVMPEWGDTWIVLESPKTEIERLRAQIEELEGARILDRNAIRLARRTCEEAKAVLLVVTEQRDRALAEANRLAAALAEVQDELEMVKDERISGEWGTPE